MAKRKSFLKPVKQVKKDAGQTLVNSIVRDGAGVGYAVAEKKLITKLPLKLQKIAPIAVYATSKLGEVFIEQPQAKAVFEGLGVSAAKGLVSSLDKTNKLGLQGIGETEETDTQVNSVDWAQMADEADMEVNAEMAGIGADVDNADAYSETSDIDEFDTNEVNQNLSGYQDVEVVADKLS